MIKSCPANVEQNILKLSKEFLIDIEKLPKHIAFIMDGNGRWAQQRGQPRSIGHKAGVDTVKTLVKCFRALNIPIMTIFAFSTENWKRPKEEVDFLMNLFKDVIDRECRELKDNGVKVNFIGKLDDLSPLLQKKIDYIKAETSHNSKLLLNVAINYGGRTEILNAVKQIGEDLLDGKLDVNNISEQIFEKYLFTTDIPDPDLLIRTSGEMRISNYLLWQIAYSELWMTPICWPDFREEQLLKALQDYQHRQRKFGSTLSDGFGY